MMPWEPTRDIMRRTMINMDFIEKHATERNGPYEVTQLINSFLGALAHPWEMFRSELNNMPMSRLSAGQALPKNVPETESLTLLVTL